jgi:uncharacterized membrane protein
LRYTGSLRYAAMLGHRCYGIALILAAAVTHIYDWEHTFVWHQVAALVPFVLLILIVMKKVKQSIPKAVSLLLAGICLLDLVAAWPLAVTLALLKMPWSLALVFPLVSLVAFFVALLLPRVTPAT